MPVYFYWGEDDFAMDKAVTQLKERVLDKDWIEFNFQQYSGDRQEDIITALNDALTPPFGTGGRLVWLKDTTIASACSAELLTELERTLDKVSNSVSLLFTTAKKPDGRLKVTKLLKDIAEVKEFALIPFWDEKAIKKQVLQMAAEIGVKLAPSGSELLQEFVGSDTRRLWNELQKLSLYQSQTKGNLIDSNAVAQLVVCNTQNSLKLAEAIRDANSASALTLLYDLLEQNEPPLKIVATLIGQFRLWTSVKIAVEAGKTDYKEIASIADIRGNPNRIRYILKDLKSLSASQLTSTLPLFLELEYSLKTGAEPRATLSASITKICLCLQSLETATST